MCMPRGLAKSIPIDSQRENDLNFIGMLQVAWCDSVVSRLKLLGIRGIPWVYLLSRRTILLSGLLWGKRSASKRRWDQASAFLPHWGTFPCQNSAQPAYRYNKEMAYSCFSMGSRQISARSDSNFFLRGPLKSTYFLRACSTVVGVGKGCLPALFELGFALRMNLVSNCILRTYWATQATSSSVFSGKNARLVAVL